MRCIPKTVSLLTAFFRALPGIRTCLFLSAAMLASGVRVDAQNLVAEWTASSAGGFGPTGVVLATESGGTFLYASDHTGGRVLKFDVATGNVVATFGSQGAGEGQFNQPYGIAIDPASGDLYVAERGNHRVQRITRTGAFVMSWGSQGTAQGQFNEPIGVAVDAEGVVYVTEHTNHRVQKLRVTQSGTTWSTTNLAMWGTQGSGDGQFNIPYGISVDGSGNVWVADGFNGRVQRFDTSGAFRGVLGGAGTGPGQFLVATDVKLDAAGNVFVCSTNPDPQNASATDANSQWISRFNAGGTFVSRWGGTHGAGPGQFRLPFFVALGANNRAYVSDYYNRRIQVFDLAVAPGGGTGGGGGDTTAPTVTAFTIAASTATSVTYRLTFSENVTGVDVADFNAAVSGGATASVANVTGAGAIYTVAVTVGGTRTVQLNLVATGSGIADASGNAFATPASAPVHTLGSAGGGGGGTVGGTKVVSATPPADGNYVTKSELGFVVKFNAPVTVSSVVRAADRGGKGKKKGGDKGDDDDDEEEDDDDADDRGDDGDDDNDSEDDERDDDSDADAPYIAWRAVDATGKGASGRASYVSGSGTDTLTFRYKVKKHDAAPNGIAVGTAIEVPEGAAIRDAAGRVLAPEALVLPWPANPLRNVVLNTPPPVDREKAKGRVLVIKPVRGATVGEPIVLEPTTESGLPIVYTLVSGNATLEGNVLTPKNRGAIVIRARVGGTTAQPEASTELRIEVADKKARAAERIVNLSSRVRIDRNDPKQTAAAGFVVKGAAAKRVLVRAVGPGLAAFGLREALPELRLELRDGAGRLVAANDRWADDRDVSATSERVGAFRLAAQSGDAAVIAALAPGAYTVQIVAPHRGVALLEIYDSEGPAATTSEQLVNLSTRGFVGTGEGVLVAGFVVAGEAPKRILIRGIGPALGAFGVPGTLADPVLRVTRGSAAGVVAANDDWERTGAGGASPAAVQAAGAAAGAFPLAAGSRDAALLLDLPPGSYSAELSGANGGTGAGLIEVYEVPSP